MQAWATEFIANRVAFLRKRKAESSGNLINSLDAEMNAQARAEAVEVLIFFSDHGRYLDMKRLNSAEGGAEYIQDIVDWIKKKGLEGKFTDNYMSKRGLTKVPEKALVYIAWGISRKRSNGKNRRKAWWNKAKTGAINDLFNRVVGAIPEKITEQIKKQFDVSIKG
jgi:hypothetical protein